MGDKATAKGHVIFPSFAVPTGSYNKRFYGGPFDLLTIQVQSCPFRVACSLSHTLCPQKYYLHGIAEKKKDSQGRSRPFAR